MKELPSGFQTDRLIARVYCYEDVAAFHQATLESLEELRRWPDALPWAQKEQTVTSTKEFFAGRMEKWAERGELAYLLFERASGEFVGAIGLHQINWNSSSCVIGAWCRNGARRRGYITEALEALLTQAKLEVGLQNISAQTNVGNANSRRFLERFGFVQAGPECSNNLEFLTYLNAS